MNIQGNYERFMDSTTNEFATRRLPPRAYFYLCSYIQKTIVIHTVSEERIVNFTNINNNNNARNTISKFINSRNILQLHIINVGALINELLEIIIDTVSWEQLLIKSMIDVNTPVILQTIVDSSNNKRRIMIDTTSIPNTHVHKLLSESVPNIITLLDISNTTATYTNISVDLIKRFEIYKYTAGTVDIRDNDYIVELLNQIIQTDSIIDFKPGNIIEFSPDYLCEYITTSKSLRKIRLGSSISINILESVMSNKLLTKIVIDDGISFDACEYMFDIIQNNRSITSVSMPIHRQCFDKLIKLINRNTYLTSLNVRYYDSLLLSMNITNLDKIINALSTNKVLRKINCVPNSSLDFPIINMTNINNLFITNNTLTKLSLPYKIADFDKNTFVESLNQNHSLTSLPLVIKFPQIDEIIDRNKLAIRFTDVKCAST